MVTPCVELSVCHLVRNQAITFVHQQAFGDNRNQHDLYRQKSLIALFEQATYPRQSGTLVIYINNVVNQPRFKFI